LKFTVTGTLRAATVGLLIAAITAACAAQAGSDGSGASIGLASPTDGATVSIPFDVSIDASVALGPPETGNHHAHLYFDTTTDSSDYDIVYGTAAQVTRQLSPGPHTIIVALANPDHSLAGPTQQLSITVGEGGGVGSPSEPAPSAPPAPASPPIGY
jgi:hypothetical protein